MARVRVRLPNSPATPSDSEEPEPEPEPEDDLLLPVGAEAELRIDDPGLLGSFYEVTVTGHLPSRGRYRVLYSTLVDDDGGPLEETAPAADVRPRPPPSAGPGRDFALHEAVEAFHNEGWWAGVVSAVPPPGRPRVYEVVFPTSRETMEFHDTHLRPHRVFKAGRWVPAAEAGDGSPLFREGTQVEVSRSAKSFGETWSPASVLKVFGSTNFLVKYTHAGEDEEAATEIIDSQYIRPARTDTRMDSKYRISRSSHVEVMHEGSWWTGAIQEVLGSGSSKKYVVKLKSFETDMDDVECLDTLIVAKTQLRPHFDWDGERWVRRLTEEFVNGRNLTSQKRPSSSLSTQKEVGESSDKNGFYRGKKLKCLDVVSERTSLLSVCIDKCEIMHKSGSYPKETMKQGNEAVALESPSLPSMEGFAHLRDRSLAQSSHPEQASSQNIITTSAPVPQSRQLQASMLGTFGQPRPLLQGSLQGKQSLNPHTSKKGTGDESIEEAINIVSMSKDLARLKDGVDDVELGHTVPAGRGMISEIDTANSVDLTMMTTPKDVGGSQQGGGSAMDDGVSESESVAVEHLPFVKTFPLWSRIEAMEVFREGPQQRPHLNQLQQLNPELREGTAFGLMLCFANLAESINMLDVEDDNNDEGGVLEEKMLVLPLLEANGFEVGDLRSRLQALLDRKNSRRRAERHYDAMKALGKKIALRETDDRELGVRIRVLDLAAHDLGIYVRLVRDVMRSTVTQKVKNAVEMARLKAEAKDLESRSAELAAPWR
uniref:Uncharacterized protein n=1 Tax=Avena sativa TaxID=4498 RepID=A0ACD5X6R7_AVESA